MHSRISRITHSLLGERWFHELGYYYLLTHRNFRNSVSRLRELKSQHQGQRCFIIGNGPSLQQMDLSPLADEITFGLNRIYLLFSEMGFATTYHVTVNKLVIEQYTEEIMTLVPGLKFISYDARSWIEDGQNVVYLFSRDGPRFYRDITKGIWQGATVTYTAMQIAYYMGFRKVILIGVDHSYSSQGEPHQTVVSQSADPNHFSPDYFGAGVRWQLPDLDVSEVAYNLANSTFKMDGREIVDATVGGKLQVFRKVDYRTLF